MFRVSWMLGVLMTTLWPVGVFATSTAPLVLDTTSTAQSSTTSLSAIPTAVSVTSSATSSKVPAFASSSDYPRWADEFSSAVVIDQETGEQLYAYQANKAWPLASITKLLTAMVFLEKRPAWTTLISMKSSDEVGGARLRLTVGSKLTVKDAYYSSLLGSANNATMAIARSTGYSKNGFVKLMNAKAKALGMSRSRFVDPTGIEVKNTSTASDIAKLAKSAYARPDIRAASQRITYAFRVRSPKVEKVIANTNILLNNLDGFEVIGGKTGYLEESRYNFVVTARDTETDRRYIAVVLGSPSKQRAFKSAEALVKWAAASSTR